MPSYPFFPFFPFKESGARLDITQPDWPRLQIDFAKPERHLIKQLLIKPDVPCSSSWACFSWQSLHALAMLWPYMLANAPTVLSLAGRGFLLRTPEGGGLRIPLFGLKCVPLNRVWFSEFLVLNMLYNFIFYNLEHGRSLWRRSLWKSVTVREKRSTFRQGTILLASPKDIQTNRKSVDRDTATALSNYSGPGYLYKKTRNIKKHSDIRKTTAIDNKLLDETRDEHYYILKR